MAAYSLAAYFEKQGVTLIESTLQRVVGKGVSYLKDDAAYRMHVMQPAWAGLPLGIRLLLKRHMPAWDALCQAVRHEVLDLSGYTIALRPDATKTIARLVRGRFDAPASRAASGATPAPTTTVKPGGPQPDSIPLAMPVEPSVPIATAPSPAPSTTAPPAADTGPVVGIDLGTTFSVVAHIDEQGRPCSLTNQDGERLTPSVVQFGDDSAVVGKQAVLRAAFAPERTAIHVKRDMGQKFYRQSINGEDVPPEVVSAFILRSLKQDAERHLGPIRRAVITVPAYFDESRRRATMDAGRLAGLQVLDIINEPTAAAIAYGYQTGYLDRTVQLAGKQPLRVLVFDLGGGTFDVTIVEIARGAFKALATDGDVNLGGVDWDEKVVEMVADRFRAQFGEDPRANPITAQELWVAAEAAKRTLTERPKAVLQLYHKGKPAPLELTRAEFEEATAPLLERTRLTTEIVVRQACLKFADLDRVLLVGGSTRMPQVQRMLEELTSKTPDRSISPDEAVAHGAALYARHLAKPIATAPVKQAAMPTRSAPVPAKRSASPAAHAAAATREEILDMVVTEDDNTDFTVTNVNSHSLGILGTDADTGSKFNKIVIPKNSPLPCTVTMPFKTYRHGQHQVLIKVLEGESENPKFCTPVGVCTVSQLPPDLPAGWPIEVSYTYENNGRLHLTARLHGYATGVSMDFHRENRLPDEDMDIYMGYVAAELAS